MRICLCWEHGTAANWWEGIERQHRCRRWYIIWDMVFDRHGLRASPRLTWPLWLQKKDMEFHFAIFPFSLSIFKSIKLRKIVNFLANLKLFHTRINVYKTFIFYVCKEKKFVEYWRFLLISYDILIKSLESFASKEIFERRESIDRVESDEDKSYVSRFISLGSCGWKTNKHVDRNGIVGASSSANVGRLLLGVGVERCSPRWFPWLARGLTEGPYPARGKTKFFSLHTSIDYFHAHYRQHTYICISLGSKAFVFAPLSRADLPRPKVGERALPLSADERYSRRSLIS